MYKIAKVVRVVDGDTPDVIFDLGFDVMLKQRIRMFGIDTIESSTQIKRKEFGLASKKYLKDNIAIAKDVVCKTCKRCPCKFGRG